MGRPSDFTQEIADEICDRLAKGESLRSISADEWMPERSTVRRWLMSSDEFRNQYARARDDQADEYADRVIFEAENATDPQLGRLRMDALKWAASKLAPKRYGDKVQVGGDEDGAPIKHALTVSFV